MTILSVFFEVISPKHTRACSHRAVKWWRHEPWQHRSNDRAGSTSPSSGTTSCCFDTWLESLVITFNFWHFVGFFQEYTLVCQSFRSLPWRHFLKTSTSCFARAKMRWNPLVSNRFHSVLSLLTKRPSRSLQTAWHAVCRLHGHRAICRLASLVLHGAVCRLREVSRLHGTSISVLA